METLKVEIPGELKLRIYVEAQQAGLSVNQWVVRVLRDACFAREKKAKAAQDRLERKLRKAVDYYGLD